jgi:hypothetical protein
MLGTIRVTRNVKDGTAVDGGRMMDAEKGFRRLRSYRYLSRVRKDACRSCEPASKSRRGCCQTQGRVGCSPNDAAPLNFNGDRNIATPRPNWAIVAIQMVAAAALCQFARGGKTT